MLRLSLLGDSVEGSAAFTMEIGADVASHYRVDEALTPGDDRPLYLGTAKDTGQRVLLFVLTKAEAGGLGELSGFEHAHLARVIELVEPEGREPVLVFERVAGETLEQRLARDGKLSPVESVRSLLRVADVVSRLHQAGGAHGFVCPASIVSSPEEERPAPVVGFAPPPRGGSPYRSPTRGEDGPPSAEDDAWAVAGLLYQLLTGKSPPVEGLGPPAELEEVGALDQVLCEVMAHGLASDEAARIKDVTELKRELARWYVDHAGDEDGLVSKTPSTAPPPLPPSILPAVKAPASSPQRRLRRLLVLAAVALPLGVGAAWAASHLAGNREVVVEIPKEPASAKVAASASAPSIDLAAVPVTSESEVATGDKTTTCVAGYLPKGAFARKAPDFGWLCAEADPRVGARKLRAAVIEGGGGTTTKAMKLVSKLGWYRMAAYSVVYAGCCVDAGPLTLPDPSAGCGRMDEPLNKLGRQVVSERDYAESLQQFEEAAKCEVRAKRSKLYRQKRKPDSSQQQAFHDLIQAFRSP